MKAMGRGFDLNYYPDPGMVQIYAKRYLRYIEFGSFAEKQTSPKKRFIAVKTNE
jgi:L-ribulokinase